MKRGEQASQLPYGRLVDRGMSRREMQRFNEAFVDL